MYCKHCNKQIHGDSHYCNRTQQNYEGDLLTSIIIGAVTDSALLGGFLGGSFLGGAIGDTLDGDLELCKLINQK